MNHVTYHHYGATILDAPIAQLHGDMDAILNAPLNLAHTMEHPITVMEEMTDCAAGTHTLTYPLDHVCAGDRGVRRHLDARLHRRCAAYDLGRVDA